MIKNCLPWCLMCFAFTLPGCRSTPKPDTAQIDTEDFGSDSALLLATSDVPSSLGLTFVDSPELQAGTGAMDAVAVPAFSQTDSGLKYRILRSSNGKKPTVASTVSVNYRGWLNSGTVFDSSYERGKPTTFPLSKVVAGWTEGMQLVGEGGMIELWVPSELGYGERGSPGSIPPHSNLHFIVELEDVQ